MKKYYIILIVLIVVVLGGWVWYAQTHKAGGNSQTGNKFLSQIFYECNGGKTINASYYSGAIAPTPAPGQPPTPTGSVALTLGDGRQMTLPQTISGSGIRYANSDESFIFWSKGNGAFVLENNQQTYTGCVQVAPDPGGLPQVYENGTQGFSIRYPLGYTEKDNYQYQEFGPSKEINGISFTISPSISAGTNLGSDSYVSVEEIPQTQDCNAGLFLEPQGPSGLQINSVTENDTTYSVASTTGAGAGNRYEETVYAIPGTNPCVAVRYFIHYGVFENYPAGTIKMFDEQSIHSQFDSIRRTLVIQQQ